MSPFRRRLAREIQLRIREMRDGCVECRARKGLCFEHDKAALELILNPRKYIDLTPKETKGE